MADQNPIDAGFNKINIPVITDVVFVDKTVQIDGKEHELVATNIPEDVAVKYTNNKLTNVGTTLAEAEFSYTYMSTPEEDPENPWNPETNPEPEPVEVTDVIGTKTATLTITKVPAPSLAGVVFADKTVTYDSKTHTLTATGVPSDATVAYKTNTRKDIGVTTAEAVFSYTYFGVTEEIETKTAKLTVEAEPKPSLDGVVFADKTVTYNAAEHTLLATNLPKNVTVTYVDNKRTEIGVSNAVATFKHEYADLSETIGTKTAKLTVSGEPVPSLDDVLFENKTVIYDGLEHEIVATNIPEDVTVAYVDNKRTEIGVSNAVATFTHEYADKKDVIGTMGATLTIESDKTSDFDEDDLATIDRIFTEELYFNYLRVGSILNGETPASKEAFISFMEVYLPEQAMFNHNHYTLLSLYNKFTKQ